MESTMQCTPGVHALSRVGLMERPWTVHTLFAFHRIGLSECYHTVEEAWRAIETGANVRLHIALVEQSVAYLRKSALLEPSTANDAYRITHAGMRLIRDVEADLASEDGAIGLLRFMCWLPQRS